MGKVVFSTPGCILFWQVFADKKIRDYAFSNELICGRLITAANKSIGAGGAGLKHQQFALDYLNIDSSLIKFELIEVVE